jgi:hypothetical protein
MDVSVARVSRSSTARSLPSRSSSAMSRPSAAGWTSWPTSATGPSGCPSATPRPTHDNNQATASPPGAWPDGRSRTCRPANRPAARSSPDRGRLAQMRS